MEKKENKRTSVGLVRVSSHTQDDLNGGSGLQFQEEKITQYCELHDLDLVKVVSDICSGSFETRDGIDEVKSLIENGEVEVVVIWNTSRCFRSMLHFTRFYEYLKKYKVELLSVSEGLSSFSKHGSMVYGIMCSISEYEREIITERMMSGKITKVKNGERKFGGKMVYGYSMRDGDVVTDKENSVIVKFIFKKMNELKKQDITKTKRTQKLLKSLKRKGYKFNGKDFTHQNIKSILKNSFYYGEMKYGDIRSTHKYETLISRRLYNNVQYV
jgi:DNA invertase Pin-like site-specific DNA recombinase